LSKRFGLKPAELFYRKENPHFQIGKRSPGQELTGQTDVVPVIIQNVSLVEVVSLEGFSFIGWGKPIGGLLI
jgi:hypothetical protein